MRPFASLGREPGYPTPAWCDYAATAVSCASEGYTETGAANERNHENDFHV